MKRNIKLLALFNFFTDFRFYSGILILYFAKVTGSYTLAMSLFSIAMLSSAFFEVPTGILSDKIGRKKTVMFGAMCAVVSVICYAIGGDYMMLAIGALIEGVGRAFYSGNNDALLHDSLRDMRQADAYDHYLGKTSAMFEVALGIGTISGSIIAYFSYPWVMWLSVIPQVICFILSFFILEPNTYTAKTTNIFAHLVTSFRHIWKNKKLKMLGLNQIIGFGVGESTFQFKSAFIVMLWPTWAIGISKSLSFIGAALSFWYAGKLIKKFKGINIMLFETSINRVINTVALVFPTILSPAIMSSTSFLYGVTEVSSNSLMQKEFTETERATLSSLVSFAGSIVFGIFSVILGFMADRTNPRTALLISQIFYLPTVYILWKLKKQSRI